MIMSESGATVRHSALLVRQTSCPDVTCYPETVKVGTSGSHAWRIHQYHHLITDKQYTFGKEWAVTLEELSLVSCWRLEFVLCDQVTKKHATIHQALFRKSLILLYSKFFSPTNSLGSFIHNVTSVKALLSEWIPYVSDDLNKGRHLSGKCLLGCCNLFIVSHLFTLLCLVSTEDSNSPICLAISGPATDHIMKASGFHGKPTAPPFSFKDVLFCSCAWSMAIAENEHRLLQMVNPPLWKSWATLDACVQDRSCLAHDAHQAQFTWSWAKYHRIRSQHIEIKFRLLHLM